MAFNLGLMVDVCMAYNAHAYFHDLDRDARGHSGLADEKKPQRLIISTTKQARHLV